jgi:hypothetical protein
VSDFLTNAERILLAAGETTSAGSGPSNLAILITAEGGIHMRDASGWALPSLEQHYGARTVYRVTQTRAGVRVEGRSRGETCLLEKELPNSVARRLLAAR